MPIPFSVLTAWQHHRSLIVPVMQLFNSTPKSSTNLCLAEDSFFKPFCKRCNQQLASNSGLPIAEVEPQEQNELLSFSPN